ncbi:hypothetical protein ACFU53_05155 [Streptomyces sp. NPDC057474]|uniref:hypothetical protein n=1 Tax=Streptomyces sp. NPDC057474 TaxID=3346144 RepID=UPI0036AC3DB8
MPDSEAQGLSPPAAPMVLLIGTNTDEKNYSLLYFVSAVLTRRARRSHNMLEISREGIIYPSRRRATGVPH